MVRFLTGIRYRDLSCREMAFETIMAGSLLVNRGRFLLLLQARVLFGLFCKFGYAIFNNEGISVVLFGSVSENMSLILRGKYLSECFYALMQSS